MHNKRREVDEVALWKHCAASIYGTKCSCSVLMPCFRVEHSPTLESYFMLEPSHDVMPAQQQDTPAADQDLNGDCCLLCV